MNSSICKKRIAVNLSGWDKGNNAEPVNNGRCCDSCNDTIVLPARLTAIFGGRNA